MIAIVDNRQNIFDVAVVNAGTAEAAYAIAYYNGISISDVLTCGQELNVDVPLELQNKRVIDFFKIQRSKPATSDIGSPGIFDETFDNTFN